MIEVWTDGSCDHHDTRRPGGWAYVIKCPMSDGEEKELTLSGNSLNTTNNQMELMAILQAIKTIKRLKDDYGKHVTLYSDSEWSVRCLTGVYNCYKDPSAGHVMFLKEIKWTTGSLIIDYQHIRAHSGILENELVNTLAVNARIQIAA